MTTHDKKTALRKALTTALESTEANVIFGLVTEELSVVVFPHWEHDGENLVEELARWAAMTADEMSEGICISTFVANDL